MRRSHNTAQKIFLSVDQQIQCTMQRRSNRVCWASPFARGPELLGVFAFPEAYVMRFGFQCAGSEAGSRPAAIHCASKPGTGLRQVTSRREEGPQCLPNVNRTNNHALTYHKPRQSVKWTADCVGARGLLAPGPAASPQMLPIAAAEMAHINRPLPTQQTLPGGLKYLLLMAAAMMAAAM